MSGLVHPHHMLQYHLISYFLARPQFLKPKMDNKAKGLGKFLRASWHMMSIGNSSWLRYNWTCSDDGLGFLTTNGRLCFLAGFDFAACFKQWAELMSAAKFSVMICNAHVQDSRVQLSSTLRNYNYRVRFHSPFIFTAGRWSWKSKSAKECTNSPAEKTSPEHRWCSSRWPGLIAVFLECLFFGNP